jgi:hypothetical protein
MGSRRCGSLVRKPAQVSHVPSDPGEVFLVFISNMAYIFDLTVTGGFLPPAAAILADGAAQPGD